MKLNRILLFFLVTIFFTTSAYARIVKTDHIEEILQEIDEETLVLFDIDDTLIDSSITLGSSHWNKYLSNYIAQKQYKNENLFDLMSYWIAYNVPVSSVEASSPEVVRRTQEITTTFGLTARGTTKWYETDISDIDLLTKNQLLLADFSFENEQSLDVQHRFGIIFTSETLKGPFLVNMLEELDYRPRKIVFVDDKIGQIQSMDDALAAFGIPAVCYHYTHIASNHHEFDPHIGIIQLYAYIVLGEVWDDKKAAEFKEPFMAHEFEMLFDILLNHFDGIVHTLDIKQVSPTGV